MMISNPEKPLQGRKLAQALVDTSNFVALPALPALPNVVLPSNVQALSNSDSGNTKSVSANPFPSTVSGVSCLCLLYLLFTSLKSVHLVVAAKD